MSVLPGDVVEHRGEAWAVVELVRSVPIGFPPHALISRNGETLRVSTAALTAITSATFTAGQKVRFQGSRHGTVMRDLGDVVEVTDERPSPAFGKNAKREYITPIPRGQLARDNLNFIVQSLGD